MIFSFHRQKEKYTCGAASMRMALESVGIKKSERRIKKLLGTNTIGGTWHKNFPKLAEKYQLNYVIKRNSSINDLKEYKKRGFTIIVCYFYPEENSGHYSVLKKINDKNIYFWDPWFGPKHKYSLDYFKKVWKINLKYDKEKCWFFAVKKP